MLKLYKESRISMFSTNQSLDSYSFGSIGEPGNVLDGLDDSESCNESESSDITVQQEELSRIQLVLNNEAYCFDTDRFAEKLVDATIEESQMRILKEPVAYTAVDVIEHIIEILINRAVNFEMGNVKPSFSLSGTLPYLKLYSTSTFWPKISEFNIKLGQEQVELYVQTWKRSSDWLFCVEFLGFESEDCSNVFVYEVEWSKPTKSYPIPQVTASVYFALEVFKMVPFGHDRSVDLRLLILIMFLCIALNWKFQEMEKNFRTHDGFRIKFGLSEFHRIYLFTKTPSDFKGATKILGSLLMSRCQWRPIRAKIMMKFLASFQIPLPFAKNVDTNRNKITLFLQEKWLQDIIDEKLKLYRKMTLSVSIPVLNDKIPSFLVSSKLNNSNLAPKLTLMAGRLYWPP